MNLDILLTEEHDQIIEKALVILDSTPLRNYSRSQPEINKDRFNKLLNVIIETVHSRDLIPMMEFSETVAKKRYTESFDIHEVQTAFNVLEEVIWEVITLNIDPKEYPKAFGVISTIIGFGKETLASTYINLLTNKGDGDKASLDRLFEGTY
jgi:hypothetical protein